MKDAKPVSTPLANHFKLNKSSCLSSTKERGDGSNSLLIRHREFDVCNGVQPTKYCSCYWSCKQISFQSREGALGSNRVNSKVP